MRLSTLMACANADVVCCNVFFGGGVFGRGCGGDGPRLVLVFF